MKNKKALLKSPKIQFEKLNYSYDMAVFHEASKMDLAMPRLNRLVLSKGKVWLDGKPIVHPTFHDQSISWSQQLCDNYSAGTIHFSPDGMAFMGTIHEGKSSEDSTPSYLSGVTPPTVFETTMTNKDQDIPGLELTIGYKLSKTGGFPEPIRTIGTSANRQDIASFSSMKVNPENHQLMIAMEYNQDVAMAGYEIFGALWPACFSLELTWDGTGFQGTLQKYDATHPGEPLKEEWVWKGTSRQHSQLSQQHTMAWLQKSPVQVLKTTTPSKSVADLMTISPDGVRDLANTMLMENMRYAMPKEWLHDLLGSEQPTLSQNRINQLNENKDFYAKKLAPAYLTWGLANTDNKAITVKLSAEQKNKLKYYFHNGLANEKGYNIQSNSLFLDAFIESSPKLQQYINDPVNDWGQKLYEALTTDAQINQVVSIIIANQSMEIPNRYSTLIACFPNKSNLAVDYNKQIMSALMMKISNNYNADDKDQIMDWLPDFIQQFITTYEHQPSNPDEQQEMARWEQAQELQEAAEQMGGVIKLADAMASVISTAGGATFYSKSSNAQEEWLRNYPKFGKVASFIRVGVLAGGIFSVVTGFMDWQNLKPKDKAGLIITTVDLAGNLILAVPDIIKVGDISLNGIAKVSRWLSSTSVGRMLSTGLDRVARALPEAPDWLVRLGTRMGEFFDSARRIIVDTAEYLSTFFRGFARFMQFFGVAVAGAFAVISTITFFEDLKNGAPGLQTAFDGIIAVAGIAETVCLVLDLVVLTTTVFAVAAAVFAVIGLIFVVVELFLPHPKPESPMDKFLKETGIPFVDKLPSPPSNWGKSEKVTSQPLAYA
jgi:hypothetical protein